MSPSQRFYPERRVLTTLNTDLINAMNTWGHSYMDTVGGPLYSGIQIANRLFSALGVAWPLARNYGQGGDVIYNAWRTMFRTCRPVRDNWGDTTWQAKFGPQAYLYGANDVGRHGDPLFESGRFLTDWTNCWRGVLSYFRAGAIYTPDYLFGATTEDHYATPGPPPVTWDSLFPGGKAGCTYTGAWSSVTSLLYASIGRDARQTTATGATISIRLPPNFPGTPVTLYFAGEVGNTGSTNAVITHGGTSPASPAGIVTNERVRSPSTYATETPAPTLVPVRIVGIPAGDKVNSQTIGVNSGTLAAGHKLTFLGWTIEATHPPIQVVANVPPPKNWSAGVGGFNTNALPGNNTGSLLPWANYPQPNGVQPAGAPIGPRSGAQAADTWVRASYNPALTSVANEFAPVGTVAIADLARVCDGTVYPELWGPGDFGNVDDLHPNPEGKAVIVKEFVEALNRVSLDPRHLIAPFDADQMAQGAAMLAGATT